jgi:hypothetical protein
MIRADYRCPKHGDFEATVESPSPDFEPCPQVVGATIPIAVDYADRATVDLCGFPSPWVPFPIRGRVNQAEVQRGTVDRPDSPMYLDTRELGEGMPMEEWRAKRDKVYEERRHKESKEL